MLSNSIHVQGSDLWTAPAAHYSSKSPSVTPKAGRHPGRKKYKDQLPDTSVNRNLK